MTGVGEDEERDGPFGIAGQRLDRLWSIEALTGDASGPIALLVVADTSHKQITLPGIPPIPVPARLSIAVTPATGGGLVVAGAAELPDPAAAAAFATALGDAQRQIAASLTTRLLLRQLRALGVVERLRVKQTDRFVTFSSSLTAGEADALLEQAATASHNYFTGRAR